MNEEVKEMGMRVGKVVDIEGRAWVIRKYPSGNIGSFQAYRNMVIYLNDHIKTEKNSGVCVSFDIGGEALVGRGYEVAVVGRREVDLVGSELDAALLTAKKLWVKFDKNNVPAYIGTPRGAMGIEG